MLKNKKLLILTPNLRMFLKDQILLNKNHFLETSIIIPQPYFPKILLNIHYFEKEFLFLKNIIDIDYHTNLENVKIFNPQFLTFPLPFLRERNPILSKNSILKCIKKNNVKFDLIHAHRLDNCFAGVILKKIYDKPLILTSHGTDVYEFPFISDYNMNMSRYTINQVDIAITVSRTDADKIVSLGLSTKKLFIIPNGFNQIFFKPLDCILSRKKLNLPLNKKILLTIGTMENIKGQIFLINAMHKINQIRKDVILIIIGTGKLEKNFKKYIHNLELDEKILLPGMKPHNELLLWINSSDLFILPSLNEGFPTVLPEVLACGKPVIATNVGGIPEIIENNDLGILIEPKNSNKLLDAILEGLNKEWDKKIILNHASKYNLINISKKILNVYDKVLL